MAISSSALSGLGVRVLASILIVLLTYNPTGYSYFDWVKNGFETDVPLKLFTGLLLLVAYVVLFRSTFYSIGLVGMLLVAAVLASLVWVAVDQGLLSLTDPGVTSWLILIGTGIVLGIGLSWALIRRQLSGQYSVDDVEAGPGDQ